jgi:ubiquinone biosynthesis protein COQ9
MNWYTRRASLAAIYSASDMFMTRDLSPDYTETTRFLERRLDQASWVGSSARQVIIYKYEIGFWCIYIDYPFFFYNSWVSC